MFGTSVSIRGNYAIVGAWADDHFSGSAYLFKWDGETWNSQVKLIASDRADNDDFGWSVSISTDYAIVGAYCDDVKEYNTGSAYIFQNFCSGADLNGDCKTDFIGYAILASWWIDNLCGVGYGWCSGSDYDKSGTVDSLDAATFTRYWLEDI